MVQPVPPSCFDFTQYVASPSKGAFKPNPQPYTTSQESLGKPISGNMFEDKHLPPQPNGTNLSGKAQGPLCKGWGKSSSFSELLDDNFVLTSVGLLGRIKR